MKTIGELLRDVSDASIKRYAATLSPIKKGETGIGSLHNEETKRLFLLMQRLDKLDDQATAKAELVDTPEEKEAELLAAARFRAYRDLAKELAWCQIHEDIGGFWDATIGVREDWLVVRRASEGPLAALKERLREVFGENGGTIEIRGEAE